MDEKTWDVIIAGGGAAGLSAALMLGRARRRVLVVDHGQPRNRFAAHMHGVLGHDGTNPAALLERGRDEAAGYGVQFATGVVQRVDESPDGVRVTTADGVVRSARAVIVATGLHDDLPPIPGLADRWGVTVLHCPYCHGWEVRDRRLGVLPTSVHGLHQAALVRQLSDQVVLFASVIGALEPATEARLRSRDVELVTAPVAEILGDGDQVTGVRLDDGSIVAVDAIFTAGAPRPQDALVAHLGLDRSDGPLGSFLTVDATGKTSSDRIWAVGNVISPYANVPMAISMGATAGAAVNMALVTEEFDAAEADRRRAGGGPAPAGRATDQARDVAEHWEARYAGTDQVWSGRPNRSVVAVVRDLPVGRALDLGCGEGGDAIWLAREGWQVTAVDISATAITRAAAAAEDAGIANGQIRWVNQDLAAWTGDGPYELVTASFLHSQVEIPRTRILRHAAGLVTPGGHLLIVSHASAPPWAKGHDGHAHRFLTPAEEVAELGLADPEWEVRIAETRSREATGPDGQPATLDDVVVLLRRR